MEILLEGEEIRRCSFFKRYRGYFSLLGGFISLLTAGTLYTYGNFSTYLVSYIHSFDKVFLIINIRL